MLLQKFGVGADQLMGRAAKSKNLGGSGRSSVYGVKTRCIALPGASLDRLDGSPVLVDQSAEDSVTSDRGVVNIDAPLGQELFHITVGESEA